MEEELYLGFVRLVGEENDGLYRYEFIFTDKPDEFWGDGFEYKPAGLVNDLMPSDEYITEVHVVKTKIKFDLAQDSTCFGMQDFLDGIAAIAFFVDDESNDNLFFMFGETFENVEKKLAEKNIFLR